MPHENDSDDDEVTNAAIRRIVDAYSKTEAIVKCSDDLMVEANKRAAIKRAASDARRVYREHRLSILVVETLLVIATLGIVKRRRNKSS